MKKRYCYLISSVFLMFLLFLFLAFAAGPDKWIECENPANCANDDNKCLNPGTGDKCCKGNEKLTVNGVDYCCIGISYTWATLPNSDVCDGLNNDCNDATADGSGQIAPNCANQVGVCSGSKKSCGGASGWLACTSTNYVANNANYESTESKCDGLDNDCDGTTDEGCDDDNDDYCDSSMTRASPYSCLGTANCCPTGGNDCSDAPNGADGIAGNIDDGANINPGISENNNILCADSIDNDCNQDNNLAWDNVATTGIDCKDLNCNTKVCGTQTITCTLNQNPSCNTATGDIYADTDTDKTCNKVCSSSVCGSCTAACDRSLKTDCVNTCTGETSASNFAADAPVTDNNLCTSGQTACPSTTGADVCGAGNVLTEYYCSGNDAASSTYDCDNSDNTGLDNTPCGDAIDGCTTRDYSCTDNSDRDYCSYAARDLDTSSSSCAAGGTATSWIATGETSAHGEYTAGQTAAACCGDDSNEKIITAGVGDTKCCSSASKCVDAVGVCRANAAENTVALCSDGIDNNCNGNIDCADSGCAVIVVPTGRCCQSPSHCIQDDCVAEDCVGNLCSYSNKNLCDATECSSPGQYCDAPGGDCKTPDESATVCGCTAVTDQTTGQWTATNHQDAGKGYNANLFNSNGAACPPTSCSQPPCTCYDASGSPINHKSALATSLCCGDDNSEYYKSDYHGPECTSSVDDCVWSDGNAQASNTGNKEYWCYMHEWYICKAGDANTVPIGTKVGPAVSQVTCAGTAGNQKWTPNAQVLAENQYSCTDGLDNDGDTKIDCADTDCTGLSGPGGVTCCQTAANCVQDDCKIESCTSNICSSSNRAQCDATECPAGQFCGSSGGNCQALNENTVSLCSDGIDNDCDGKIDCADSDCAGTISGSVKDTDNNPIGSAKIDALKNAVLVYMAFTNALGNYAINDNQYVICGSYDLIASASQYVSETKTIQLQPNEAKAVDFTLTLGTSCEADCTYAGDTTIHQECEGINGCKFCPDGCTSPTCTSSIAKQSCNLAQPGWDRLYNDPSQCANGCVITCQESCPVAKIETKAKVTCPEGENIIKATKLVMYKGKLTKLNVVVCS